MLLKAMERLSATEVTASTIYQLGSDTSGIGSSAPGGRYHHLMGDRIAFFATVEEGDVRLPSDVFRPQAA